MFVILALGKLKQEYSHIQRNPGFHSEFQANLRYIVSSRPSWALREILSKQQEVSGMITRKPPASHVSTIWLTTWPEGQDWALG